MDALLRSRLAGTAIAIAGAAILGTALAFQHVGGLVPCDLCYMQRYPFWIAIPAGLAAGYAPAGKPRAALLAIAAAALTYGAGVAAFHTGVEQGWWEGLASCSSPRGLSNSLEELRARLLAAPVVRCDEPQWSLFGVTMAGYNFLLSGALAAFAGMSAWFALRGETK
ncbi:MAG: disulfide bond formation protein B [Alphaproteobacteria bacterium]|nr:disulfide bond formation protein B [Alphaproteobacteria bacterium]